MTWRKGIAVWLAPALLVLLAGLGCRSIPDGIASPAPPASSAAAQDTHPESLQPADIYSGVAAQVTQPTGFFNITRKNDRWLFVTPEGNAFWLRAVYGLDYIDGGNSYGDALRKKYAPSSPDFPWWTFAAQSVRRMRSWGFNTIGEYSSPYMYPVPTYGRPNNNSEQAPFIRLTSPASDSLTNRWGWAPGPAKDIITGVDPAIYTGYRSTLPDVFDANFVATAQKSAADAATSTWTPLFRQGLANLPWLIGTSPDDADNLWGFKRSTDAHVGWMVAVTMPSQTRNTRLNVSYADPVVYSKRAWRNYLATKYGTVTALNNAWNSGYTTFDSDGGWPNGKGVLDESGRNPWIGKDPSGLSDVTAVVKADLNKFLEQFADQYFSTVSGALRKASPHNLVFSPTALSNARPEILQSAARYVDAVQIFLNNEQWQHFEAIAEQVYSKTHKPIIFWLTIVAQADSPLSATPLQDPSAVPVAQNQADRGRLYANLVKRMWEFQASDGSFPIVGLDWWEWTDKITGGERANFGLVTNSDNAYDGKEDVVAAGTDAWGFPTGRETRSYSDFLSAVRDANVMIDQRMRQELVRKFRRLGGANE